MRTVEEALDSLYKENLSLTSPSRGITALPTFVYQGLNIECYCLIQTSTQTPRHTNFKRLGKATLRCKTCHTALLLDGTRRGLRKQITSLAIDYIKMTLVEPPLEDQEEEEDLPATQPVSQFTLFSDTLGSQQDEMKCLAKACPHPFPAHERDSIPDMIESYVIRINLRKDFHDQMLSLHRNLPKNVNFSEVEHLCTLANVLHVLAKTNSLRGYSLSDIWILCEALHARLKDFVESYGIPVSYKFPIRNTPGLTCLILLEMLKKLYTRVTGLLH